MKLWKVLLIALAMVALPVFAHSARAEPSAADRADEAAARSAADRFGTALVRGDAAALRPLLPQRGKLQLQLDRLRAVDGSFSARQTQALMQEILDDNDVQSFEVTRLEHRPGLYAIVHARASVVTADGRTTEVELRLDFQNGGEKWILREIRESAP